MKQFYLALMILIIAAGCKKGSIDIFNSVEFTLKSPNAYINQAVNFTIFNPSGTTYTWAYGDGTTQTTSTSPTHTYTKSGIYTVTVKSATLSFSKKVRIYPGTCSLQFKNSFTHTFTVPTIDIYDAGGKELLPAKVTLNEFGAGTVTDTIFVNLPVLSYNPNITLGLNFKNANNKNISFSSTSFITAAGHTVYEIKDSLSGMYYYSTSAGTFISGTNTLVYTDTIK